MAVIRGTDGADRLDGTAAADRISGLAGNDRLIGRGGDDVLNGGPGADRLEGGAGSDTAGYGGETAAIFADLDDGTVSTITGTDVLVGVENVAGSRFDDQFFGDGAANVFRGRAGNDTFEASGGGDRYEGGSGIDTVAYRNALARVAIDLRAGTGTSEFGSDRFVAIENLDGGAGGDRLYGSDVDNALFGDDGDDDLRGRGGDDVLQGGTGRDRLFAGAGKDLVDGGGGGDVLAGGAASDLFRYLPLADVGTLAERAGADLVLDFSRLDDLVGAEIAYEGAGGRVVTESGDALFGRLDSNRNGRLDDADRFVAVRDLTVGGETAPSTVIDFGAAANQLAGATLLPAGTQTLTLFDVIGMSRADFFDTTL